MGKIGLILSIFFINIYAAKLYYGVVEPVNSYNFEAAVAGKVVDAKKSLEGLIAKDVPVVKIDSYLDKIDLKYSIDTLALLNDRLKNQSEVVRLKKASYDRIKDLKTRSVVDKESTLSNYLSALNTEISIKEQIASTKQSIENLKDRLKNKSLQAKGLYIYKVYVDKGQYVNVGTKLFDAYDINSGKIVIYVDRGDIKDIKSKKIYINDKKTDYKLDKLYDISDSTHISSYKAEIIIDAPEVFSDVVKVEFKDN